MGLCDFDMRRLRRTVTYLITQEARTGEEANVRLLTNLKLVDERLTR